jgi:hypothetical protein
MLQKSTVKFDITADASERTFVYLFRAVGMPSANQYFMPLLVVCWVCWQPLFTGISTGNATG